MTPCVKRKKGDSRSTGIAFVERPPIVHRGAGNRVYGDFKPKWVFQKSGVLDHILANQYSTASGTVIRSVPDFTIPSVYVKWINRLHDKRNNDMNSESEIICKLAFNEFLESHNAIQAIQWQCGDEPPDFYVLVDGVRYAVEVTIMMDKIKIGEKAVLPYKKNRDNFDKWVKTEIKPQALEENILRGEYIVMITKPIPSFSEIKRSLHNDIISFIRETQNAESTSWHVVHKRGRELCQVIKSKNNGSNVIFGGPVISARENEMNETMCQLLDDRLKTKTRLLQNITEPKILLLHNQYGFVDPMDYVKCKPEQSLLNPFHTIFITRHDKKYSVLHSKNDSWLKHIIRLSV